MQTFQLCLINYKREVAFQIISSNCQLFICSFTHHNSLLICLLYARHYSRSWGYSQVNDKVSWTLQLYNVSCRFSYLSLHNKSPQKPRFKTTYYYPSWFCRWLELSWAVFPGLSHVVAIGVGVIWRLNSSHHPLE